MPQVTLHSRVVHRDYEFSIHKINHDVDVLPTHRGTVAVVIDRHGHVEQFRVQSLYEEGGATHVRTDDITVHETFGLDYVTGWDCFPGAGWQVTSVECKRRH